MNPSPPTQPTSSGLVLEIHDGPEDKPNFKRTVRLICWDALPGMVLCEDTQTGEIVRVDRQKIEKAMNAPAHRPGENNTQL